MSHESDTPVSTSDLMHHSAPEEGATPENHVVRADEPHPGDEIAPTRYRKIPVEIEALRWCGHNLRQMIDFTGLHPSASKWTWDEYEKVVRTRGFKIFSLEAAYIVPVGHYVIKGVQGEFYACDPAIFAKTYRRSIRRPDDRAEPK